MPNLQCEWCFIREYSTKLPFFSMFTHNCKNIINPYRPDDFLWLTFTVFKLKICFMYDTG